jgi:hypothetical protein
MELTSPTQQNTTKCTPELPTYAVIHVLHLLLLLMLLLWLLLLLLLPLPVHPTVAFTDTLRCWPSRAVLASPTSQPARPSAFKQGQRAS